MTKPFPKIPLRRAEGLHVLDAEVVAGYRAGLKGETEPNPNASYPYWHGWRNGLVDSGRVSKDGAQAELARDVAAKGAFGVSAVESPSPNLWQRLCAGVKSLLRRLRLQPDVV